MLQDLDASLKAVLGDPTAPASVKGADINFDPPAIGFSPTQPTINVFLHEVSENRLLRDDARIATRVGDTYSTELPPIRLDCTYLVTAWSVKAGGLRTQEEHLLLGQALAWLARFPLLDPRFLQGSLAAPAQPYPLPMVVARLNEGRGMGEFWSALGIPPKAAFSVTVTIAAQLVDDPVLEPAPKAFILVPTSIPEPALTGRVLDAMLQPVTPARVTVIETAVSVPVGTDGEFRFPLTAFGPFTLSASIPGHPDVTVDVVYGLADQVHNIFVPGP